MKKLNALVIILVGLQIAAFVVLGFAIVLTLSDTKPTKPHTLPARYNKEDQTPAEWDNDTREARKSIKLEK